jgi:hypothetical protein
MARTNKTEPLLELVQALGALAEQHRDLTIAARVQDVARELQRELEATGSKPVTALGAAAIAKELDALAARTRKAGLAFTARLIDMAAYSVRHPD